MKTILLISPYWREKHRWMVSSVNLADLWQKLGYRVVVACMGSKTETQRVSDTLTIHSKKDIFLKDPLNFGISFGFTGFVKRLIKAEKPDIIVCNKVLFWTSFSLIPLRLVGKKIILLTDALVGITWQPRGLIPKIIMSIGAWTIGWLVLLSAKKIIFYHPQPEKILKRLGIFKKSQVIPSGVDSGKFKCDQEKDKDRRVSVTYVGRLESVKGVDDFIAAALPLKKDYPDLRIQVVGWYKERHPLVEKYRDDIIFTGLVDDTSKILGRTDIFVLPSYSEGLSNALMEAMSSCCACIASDVGGNRFLIQNGISGLLFPAGDREALRAHVRRLLDDPAKRCSLGKSAEKRIKETFDWKKVGKQYQDLFENSEF